MKVLLKEHGNHRIRLYIPAWLVFNPLTVRIAPKVLQGQGICMTGEQIALLGKTLRTCRKHHRGLKLVEIHSADGDVVEITL